MPETKKTMNIFGKDVAVADVPILSAKEGINEYTLEDGSVLRVKNVANSFVRIEGQTLPDGSPVYLVFGGPVITVVSWKPIAAAAVEKGPKTQ
jgi:hypothetical protein